MIKEYANLKGYYGAPKITKNLCAKGIKCSVSKVSRAMKTLGIRSIVAEKFVHRKSSMSEEEKSKIVNLVKNLEITGTTAKEAEETISGSISSMKSAWDNFLNGSGTFDQFVDAAKVALKNIATAVSEQLPRIAKEIAEALPEGFVTAVKVITPVLITLGTALRSYLGIF